MHDSEALLTRLRTFVTALLPSQWRNASGERFRKTMTAVSEYSEKNIHIEEKVNEAPTVLWETLKKHSSQSLVNAAEEEQKRIDTELKRRTLADKARQEKANADRFEAEARIAKISEIDARINLVEKLRSYGAVPVWGRDGSMMVLKTPAQFDWDGLSARLIDSDEVALTALKNAEIDTGSTKPKPTFPTSIGFQQSASTPTSVNFEQSANTMPGPNSTESDNVEGFSVIRQTAQGSKDAPPPSGRTAGAQVRFSEPMPPKAEEDAPPLDEHPAPETDGLGSVSISERVTGGDIRQIV